MMSEEPTASHFIARIRGVLTSIGAALLRLDPAINVVVRVIGQILEFGRRWILRFLLVGLVLLPTAAILGLLFSGAWTPDKHVAAMALWVALSIAIAGGAWALLWILLRLILRLVRSSSLGHGVAPRLIALLCRTRTIPKDLHAYD